MMPNNECQHSPIVTETVDMLFRRSKLVPKQSPRLFSLLLTLAEETLVQSNVAHRLTEEEEAILERSLSLPFLGKANQEDWANPCHPVLWDPRTHLLYFSKHWGEERRIGEFVRACLQKNEIFPPPSEEEIRALSPKLAKAEAAGQVEGVRRCVGHRLAMLTGGPGTGKTTTLGAILAWEFRRNPELSVALCAPTGKAAGQMMRSLREELEEENGLAAGDPATREKLKALQATTLHRLLGITLSRQGLPQFHRDNRLPYDLVVLDEGSMADLHLFARLTDALPENGRLLLLGDKDQLDSVETGVVFGDLAKILPKNCTQFLAHNFRSREIPELVEFAQLLSREKEEEAEAMAEGLFAAPKEGKFRCEDLQKASLGKAVKEIWQKWRMPLPPRENESQGLSPEEEAESWLAFHDKFKILSPLRKGKTGVEEMNQIMESLLGCGKKRWGLPVLNTRNDSATHLQNGDIGVRLGDQVFFRVADPQSGETTIQGFPWAMLQEQCEPAYAMTIHKSQGSSYDHVLVVFPDTENPLLTRNLLYTAITRAKKDCTIWAPKERLKEAILTTFPRVSGLAEACQEADAQDQA